VPFRNGAQRGDGVRLGYLLGDPALELRFRPRKVGASTHRAHEEHEERQNAKRHSGFV
jgi:hypothetical protein